MTASVLIGRRGAVLEWPQFLLRVLVILSVFEADRSFMVYTDVIARFKDVVIILLFVITLRSQGWTMEKSFFHKSAFGWLLVYVTLSFPISLYSQLTPFGSAFHMDTSFGWAVYLRVIYYCLLVYCMRLYFQRHPNDIAVILRLFVNACAVFVIFNLVAYFYHFPFLTVFRPWPGRISNGYPTSDALMLLMALVAHMMILFRRRAADFFVAFVLLLGVFANATGSGIACLGLLAMVYAVANFRRHPSRVLLYAVGASIVLVVSGFAGYFLLETYDPIDLAKGLLVLQARGLEGLSVLANGVSAGASPGSGSITIRYTQFLYRIRYNETWFDDIFGLGAFYGYIENQFFHVLVVWGAAGLTLFFATLVESLSGSLKANRYAMLYWLIIWMAANMVLITTYLFSLFVPFAILLGAAGMHPLARPGCSQTPSPLLLPQAL